MLADREHLLAEMHSVLGGGGSGGPRIVALYGLGGVGKTSVAVEYAHRHQAAAAVAWQFPAEDAVTLTAEFARLAAVLGVAGFVLDSRDPVSVVHAWLAACESPWLLIFDNAADEQAIRRFVPPAGNGQVLVTSQSAMWPPGQAMEVPLLDPEAAAAFLTARAGDADRGAAAKVADELGGLPLALEQAGAYIAASGSSLAEYLDLFRCRRAELLGRGDPAGYDKTVATTWSMAIGRLGEESPAAIGLLRLLACCGPEPAPARLLLESCQAAEYEPEVARYLGPLLGDGLAAADAVAALRRYSLVSSAGDRMVLVHRLVQAVTIDQMQAEVAEAWRRAAADLIEAAIPADILSPENAPVLRSLLPHAQAALPDHSHGLAQITNWLGRSGSYRAARDLYQKIAAARQRKLGAEHAGTLNSRHDLAHWTGLAGDAVTARDQLAGLLRIRERVLGPEHPDTLTTRHSLGYWTGRAGDLAGARDQLAGLVQVRQRVLGPEHPDTLNSRHDLALSTGAAGDAEAARDQLAALAPVRERVLGADHPDTLATRDSLAVWTGWAGDAASARDQLAALVPVFERVLGADHPDTLAARADLAYFTGDAGDEAAARDELAALAPAFERMLDGDHPETLRIRNSLASWTGLAGNAAAARDQIAALLPVRERVLGAHHPETLATRANLAIWTGWSGDAAAARDQLAALVPVLERVLGAEHPETLAARANLASWTGLAGDLAAARDQLAAELPIRDRVLGADHPRATKTRREHAYWTHLADHREARSPDPP